MVEEGRGGRRSLDGAKPHTPRPCRWREEDERRRGGEEKKNKYYREVLNPQEGLRVRGR